MSKSRYGWRWVLVAIGGLAWISLGCSPQTLSALVMPFSDNNIQPEYKLFAKDKEITLAVLVNFASPPIQPDIQAAPAELAEMLSVSFRKRCEENKHKIKIIPDAQIRSEEAAQRQVTGGDVSPVQLGKALKADYVLDLTINSFSLYAKEHYPPMYRGKADIAITLFKVDAKTGEHKVFFKDFTRQFPRDTGPIEAATGTAGAFRRAFLAKTANDVTKTFISFPPDERREID
jgi:hypothetical protein